MRHRAFAAAMGALTAALLAPSAPSQAASADPTGYWMKPDAERESKIQVFKCGKGKSQLCAKIAWLKDPLDSKGQPLRDIRNENPSLRGRSIVGLTIFTGLTPSAPGTWTGKIYNPEDGHTYSATLKVVSQKQILLKGCKAWLLCGERQWLRTSAPPQEVKPAIPAEGTEQIEASADRGKPRYAAANAAPPVADSVKPARVAPEKPAPTAASAQEIAAATPAALPVAEEAKEDLVEPSPALETASTEPSPRTASISAELAVPATPPANLGAREGYRFLSLSPESDVSGQVSGENVSSMIAMSEPVAAQDRDEPVATPPAETKTASVTQDAEPVPLPAQKPKLAAATAAKRATKPASQAKPAAQAKPVGQPAPKETAAEPEPAETQEAKTTQSAEASMVETAPLTRRQKRLLRRQQMQGEPLLPWLR